MKLLRGIMVILLFILFITNNSQAQTICAGIIAGPQASYLSGSDGLTIRLGYQAGGILQYRFSERFALQPQILFSQQGAATDDGDGSNLRLTYIHVPVLARWYPVGNFYLQAGPQASLLISAAYIEGKEKEDLLGDFNKMDISGSAGFGYEISSKLDIGLRYTYGFTDIFKREGVKWQNQVLSLTIGYIF